MATSKQKLPNEGDVSLLDSQRSLQLSSAEGQALRYYFAALKLLGTEIRLSFRTTTTSRLSEDLRLIRQAIPIPFAKFEDAVIPLGTFRRDHFFDTRSALLKQIGDFYSREVPIASILLSANVFGNPSGMYKDLSLALDGLVNLNLPGAVRNVTHAFSDATSKMTGSASSFLGRVTMDTSYQEEQEQLIEHCRTSGDHLMAGLAGLAHGILGGLTSVAQQTYEGGRSDGVQGFFTGLGKGLVGTATKPVAGALDFASGVSAAVRQTTRAATAMPPPLRLRRCCVGSGGVLMPFSERSALGQKYLLQLNEGDVSEMFVAFEAIRSAADDKLYAIISARQVFFISGGKPVPSSVLFHAVLDDLVCAEPVRTRKGESQAFYIRLVMKGQRLPQVRCDSEKIARRVSQQIMYAKTQHQQSVLSIPQEYLNTADIW